MPLATKLNSGDIVEIMTKKGEKPKRRWLDFVKTTMAKKHIRAYLTESKDGDLAKHPFPKKLR